MMALILFVIGLRSHFGTVPQELLINLFAAWMWLTVTVFTIERDSRLVFKMFHEMQKLDEKQTQVLKLFPESMAIVNFSQKSFEYYNEAFSTFYAQDMRMRMS